MRFFLIGFMGSGKSYWGKKWADDFGLKWFDLDDEIEKVVGCSIADFFREKGEVAFRKKEKEVLHSFRKKDHFILSCGGGTPCYFNNMKWMNRNGIVIYLKSHPSELAQRLFSEKENRPLLKDVPNAQLEQFIEQKLNERNPDYQKAFYHLPTRFITNENFERIFRRHG